MRDWNAGYRSNSSRYGRILPISISPRMYIRTVYLFCVRQPLSPRHSRQFVALWFSIRYSYSSIDGLCCASSRSMSCFTFIHRFLHIGVCGLDADTVRLPILPDKAEITSCGASMAMDTMLILRAR